MQSSSRSKMDQAIESVLTERVKSWVLKVFRTNMVVVVLLRDRNLKGLATEKGRNNMYSSRMRCYYASGSNTL